MGIFYPFGPISPENMDTFYPPRLLTILSKVSFCFGDKFVADIYLHLFKRLAITFLSDDIGI